MNTINRVVLIEDDPDDIYLISRAFKEINNNIKLDVFKNSESFMERFISLFNSTSSSVDLILLDLNLGNENGLDILRALKELQETKFIPVTIFTTSYIAADAKDAYAAGANAFVTKPSSYAELIKCLTLMIDFWQLTTTVKSNGV
jgi:CheY-like chemotaxis protein